MSKPKHRVTIVAEVPVDIEGVEELFEFVTKAVQAPWVKSVKSIQRVITEEVVDGASAS